MVLFNTAQLELWLAAFIWPFLRILAVLSTAPVFDNKAVTRRLRIGLAACMAILIAPLLPPPLPLNSGLALAVLLQQLVVGVAIGFSMRLVFTAFEMAGDLVGLQMGLAFAQFIDPTRGGQSPLIGSFFGILASLVFLAIDGHLLIIAALVQSFELVPISAKLDVIFPNHIASAGSVIFMLAVQIALPVITAILICNIVLGLLTRAAPQMNIMSIGFSITILAGLAIVWVSLPSFIANVDAVIERMLNIAVLRP